MTSLPRISIRAALPISIAIVAIAASLAGQFLPAPDQGLRLAYVDGQVEVASVEYGSAAFQSGIQPGVVVQNLDDLYVLGLSDQAKRSLAALGGSWTRVITLSRGDADSEQATFTQLMEAARSSDIPWLSDPANHPLPPSACAAGDTGCLHGAAIKWGYANSDDVAKGICVPTVGDAIATELSQANDAGLLCIAPGPPVTYMYLANSNSRNIFFLGSYETPDPAPVVFGLTILAIGWLVVGRGWVGSTLRPYALTLPLATAIPLLARPIDNYPSELAVVVGSLLVPLAMLPLAIDFLGRIDGRLRRRFVGLMVAGLAIGSAVAGLLRPEVGWSIPNDLLAGAFLGAALLSLLVLPLMLLPGRILALNKRQRLLVVVVVVGMFWLLATASVILRGHMTFSEVGLLRAVLAGGVVFIPGLLAARPFHRAAEVTAVGARQTTVALVSSADIALAAMTPGIAAICLVHSSDSLIWPIIVWLIIVPIAGRLVLRPLGLAATSAQRQRDLVVAATEAERMRIAADIHDEALQDLTMLVRRLDAAGDTANADSAREIAERLRAICGDLRLPVLDDLGVGPALEWLCGRLGSASESITLDRSAAGEVRLPADVELAVFRIAQEALSNAVRHGAPPIVVRYRTRPDAVELTVDDHGSGIPGGSAELAEKSGHMGLMNMTQRAEAIGAGLKIARKPEGGTRVSLTWQRAASPDGAAVPAPAPA
jgi:signal transduction histidine kinase